MLTLVGGFLIYASATTLKVKDVEDMAINGNVATKVYNSKKILTWNVGYGALDEKQDCYWDGGKGVTGKSKDVVKDNVNSIITNIKNNNPDIFFIQEIDINSKRSFEVNELEMMQETFANEYQCSYACIFKAGLFLFLFIIRLVKLKAPLLPLVNIKLVRVNVFNYQFLFLGQ